MASDNRITMIVARREIQGDGVVVLDLVPEAGGQVAAFEAGAHIDLELGPVLTRQYSICSDPADLSFYRLGILNDPASRGGSRAVYEKLLEGSSVIVGAPRNLFPLEARAKRSILLGGGIGITPMLAMAAQLNRDNQPFELHYFARERNKAAFLKDLSESPFAAHVRLHFDNEPDTLFAPGRDLPAPADGTYLYVCGPEGFMTWVRESAKARGFGADQIRQEFFSAEVDSSGDSFEVLLNKSGKTITVNQGETIIEALKGVGIKIKVSCEKGVCGTCVCDVLEGVPDHRDVYLTDEEKEANDQIVLCCSRSKTSRLVIDL